MSKYEFEYDSWFRDDIPKAQYGSLQCWIENGRQNLGRMHTI